MALQPTSFQWARNYDGSLDGAFPTGNKPPDILAWNIGVGLEQAGISNLIVDVPFVHDVRQYLIGNESSIATISIINISGDNAITSGWAINDDDIEFTGTEEGAGTFLLRATGAGSPPNIVDSEFISWSCNNAVIQLQWDDNNLTISLSTSGIDSMLTETPFSHNVRQYLSGTNAGTATLSLINVSGDNPTTNGWTAPGLGNNIVYDGVDAHSGIFRIRASDGINSVDSASIAWSCTESPTALSWDNSTMASNLISNNIQTMLTGIPFSHNVRQYLSGTNSASATITFVNVSGDNPTTNGWTAPGSGNNIAYDATNVRNGSFRLRAVFGNEVIESTVISWACTDSSSQSRTVFYSATFDSGSAQSNTSLINGGYFACKYQPEGGVNTYFSTTSGGGNGLTDSNLDMRVLTSETFNSSTITPRRGSHFLRQVLYYTKEYECLNGADSGTNDNLDKPRIKYSLTNAVYEHDFDREVWLGFSLFTHPNHVHDIATRTHSGSNNHVWLNGSNNASQWGLYSMGRPTSAPLNWTGGTGGNSEHWIFIYQKNATAVADMSLAFGSSRTFYVALDDRENDRGLWTDFVIRYRINPFTTDTNASTVGGKNHLYEGNKGICQIWKSKGSYINGNKDRTMEKVLDIFNAPFGGVPISNQRLLPHLGIYKYGWKKNPTSTTNPIYNAKDEIRWGFRKPPQSGEVINQSGTKDVDVNPSGLPLPGWIEQD